MPQPVPVTLQRENAGQPLAGGIAQTGTPGSKIPAIAQVATGIALLAILGFQQFQIWQVNQDLAALRHDNTEQFRVLRTQVQSLKIEMTNTHQKADRALDVAMNRPEPGICALIRPIPLVGELVGEFFCGPTPGINRI